MAIALALAFGIGGAVALAAGGWLQISVRSRAAPQTHPVWTEMSWPFPMDEWGRGKAYRCTAADCGAEVQVYLRAKIGFCNCSTGVAHDEDLARLSDFSLLGGTAAALNDGRSIAVGWMKGRVRAYRTTSGMMSLLAAFHNECDALVATAVFDRAAPAGIEAAVIGFLNSRTALDWARTELGL